MINEEVKLKPNFRGGSSAFGQNINQVFINNQFHLVSNIDLG